MLKRILTGAVLVGALSGQQEPQFKIEEMRVRGESPLRAPTCKESSYGYLHIGYRRDLTPAEIGQYVIDDTADGKVLTVYPKSESGIFVYADCPKR